MILKLICAVIICMFNSQNAYAEDLLAEQVGQMIVMGFEGKLPEDYNIKKVLKHAKEGRLGGVVFFSNNIENKDQFLKLTSAFAEVKTKYKLFLCIDQEGGKVQRLKSKNGFRDFNSAKQVAHEMSVAEAEIYYQSLSKMLKEYHINFNFAPVVDVDFQSPIIGYLERSFSSDPKIVVKYAKAFMNAMHKNAVIPCLKHFPGHGSAQGDTHKEIIDISNVYNESAEMYPFEHLASQAAAIMTAHVYNKNIDLENPATLSYKTLKKIPYNFKGVIVSDDMHMGAMLKRDTEYKKSFEKSIIDAINAGVDLIVCSNNPKAAKGIDSFQPDHDLPLAILDIVKNAVKTGKIAPTRIEQSYKKIIALKTTLLIK